MSFDILTFLPTGIRWREMDGWMEKRGTGRGGWTSPPSPAVKWLWKAGWRAIWLVTFWRFNRGHLTHVDLSSALKNLLKKPQNNDSNKPKQTRWRKTIRWWKCRTLAEVKCTLGYRRTYFLRLVPSPEYKPLSHSDYKLGAILSWNSDWD